MSLQVNGGVNQPLGYAPINSVPVDGGETFPIVSVCFDHYEELLWDGNAGVCFVSLLVYVGAGVCSVFMMFRCVSFSTHICI